MNDQYSWQPQPGPQHHLVTCPVFEIFYGGARGGGKTDGMLGKFAIKAKRHGEHCVGIFFRKSREDLQEAIERSKDIYTPLGAELVKSQWRFPNGARLKFEYLANDKDAENYQGHSYTDVFFEELTNWATSGPVNKLKATLRSAHGVPCQFHATGNPGGPGHLWVKHRYIDPAPEGMKVLTSEYENPFTGEKQILERIFIPSKLTDNKILIEADPYYIAKLQESGSEQLVKAWLLGDWNIIEGAYFDCWSDNMIIKPFKIPEHWTKFRSMDWGFAAPFSVGWWAMASEDYTTECGTIIPQNAMVRYREWYGCEKDKNGVSIPNKGLRLNAKEVAEEICRIEGRPVGSEDKMSRSPCDPHMFSSASGPSIGEDMYDHGVKFVRGDNKRVAVGGHIGGWNQMRSRMKGEEGRPMIFTFETCYDSIRTIPVLQHDKDKAEDLDTTQEDHAADEWRYACMSRAVTAPEVELIPDNTWDAPTASQMEKMFFNG